MKEIPNSDFSVRIKLKRVSYSTITVVHSLLSQNLRTSHSTAELWRGSFVWDEQESR